MFQIFHKRTATGFTLIELLVVCAILSVLAAVVLFSVDGARANARDKQRKIDLKTIQLAVDQYKEAYDSYPLSCRGHTPGNRNNNWGGAPSGPKSCPGQDDEMVDGVVPIFISALPKDPKETGQRGYLYASDGQTYKIMALQTVESAEVKELGDEWARCPAGCDTVIHDSCRDDENREHFHNTYAVYGGNSDLSDDDSIMCF